MAMLRGVGEWPFVGSEALATEVVNRHQLRTRYRAELPDVYVAKHAPLSLSQRTTAAWLWSGREATIAGLAAAALHGAKWVDDDTPIELIHTNPRAPGGVVTRRETVLDGEVQTLAGPCGEVRVTTPERTAFDIGRRGSIRSAIARLDALARATDVKVDDIAQLADRHPHTRGRCQLAAVLDLVDPRDRALGAAGTEVAAIHCALTALSVRPWRNPASETAVTAHSTEGGRLGRASKAGV